MFAPSCLIMHRAGPLHCGTNVNKQLSIQKSSPITGASYGWHVAAFFLSKLESMLVLNICRLWLRALCWGGNQFRLQCLESLMHLPEWRWSLYSRHLRTRRACRRVVLFLSVCRWHLSSRIQQSIARVNKRISHLREAIVSCQLYAYHVSNLRLGPVRLAVACEHSCNENWNITLILDKITSVSCLYNFSSYQMSREPCLLGESPPPLLCRTGGLTLLSYPHHEPPL